MGRLIISFVISLRDLWLSHRNKLKALLTVFCENAQGSVGT